MVKGLLLVFVDNSNYQVDADQLEFLQVQLANAGQTTPIVILLHIPLMLPGVTLPAKELCGHAQWGAAADTEPWLKSLLVPASYLLTQPCLCLLMCIQVVASGSPTKMAGRKLANHA